MYTRIRRIREEYSCHVVSLRLGLRLRRRLARPSLGGTLSSPAPQGSGASLAMFACALKHPLTRQDSIDPLNPPYPRGFSKPPIYICMFFQKRRHVFGPFLQTSMISPLFPLSAPFWCVWGPLFIRSHKHCGDSDPRGPSVICTCIPTTRVAGVGP